MNLTLMTDPKDSTGGTPPEGPDSSVGRTATVGTAGPVTARRGDTSFAWRMLAPALILVGAVLIFPLAYSLYTSLNDVSNRDLSLRFVGLSNYREMFRDPLFLTALGNTLYFAAMTIVATVLLGLAVALVLNERFRGRHILRTIIVVPWALSQVVVGVIWGWIFNGSFGIFNGVLTGLHLINANRGWLSEPHWAMPLVAMAFVWSVVPFAAIMYLAALQAVPADLYKAARVDGADTLRSFWHVTVPHLRYTTLIVLLVASVDGLLAFSLLFVMTGGGPGTTTTVLSWLGYQTTFVKLDLGTGAATFYLLVAILMVLAGVYIRVLQGPREKVARA
jgi:multiple sugar transport system permease protein